MKEIDIIDDYMDEREFRNYVNSMFIKYEFDWDIDDDRVDDFNPNNDNDIKVYKDGKKYTVQTYLNQYIDDDEIAETLDDMITEGTDQGIIVTNYNVPEDIKDSAFEKNILILDRTAFNEDIYK